MVARKRSKQELSKEAIIESARTLFAQLGYQKVTMRQVAKELDCSHGAIYYHFQNKQELFSAIVASDFQQLNEKITIIMNSDNMSSHQMIQAIFLDFIKFGIEHPKQYEMMFLILNNKEDNLHLQQAPYESYEQFATAIASLSETKLSIQAIWSVFLSLHGFVSHYIYCDQSFEEIEALANGHVNFLMKALSRCNRP